MKKNIIIFAAIVFFLFPLVVSAEIPMGVSITKINITGSYGSPDGGDINVDIKGGRVIYPESIHEGQWNVRVNYIDYNLNFFNVGEEGGREGMLWWKKDHGLATLSFTYNFSGPGYIWGEKKEIADSGMFQYPQEEASGEPDIGPVVYKLRFTGGPMGKFEEIKPYKSSAGPVTGEVSYGNKVRFKFPKKDLKEYPYYIQENFMAFDWAIEGNPFFGYPDNYNENPCEGIVAQATEMKWPEFIKKVHAKDSGARISDWTGEVTVFPGSDPDDSRLAELDTVLEVEDHIKTEDDSCAIISFADMTTFVMGPSSEIILDTPPERKSKISLIAGDIWTNVKKMVKDGSMDVTMNQAVAGIKGTTFIASERNGVSTLKVIEGEVEYKSLKTDDIVLVNGGEMVEATETGLKEKTIFDAGAENKKWTDIRTSLESKSSGTPAGPGKTEGGKGYLFIVGALAIIAGVVARRLKRGK